ncbi:MAG TPA: HTTM domain-containing protein [Candidatus Binatia bacterium]|nr:HTTM domain-containing protein [Candidatus Binatia bacterium]
MIATLKSWLAIDLRSLAALRIGVAVVALWDLGVRACDLAVHYTDAGTLARQDVLTWFDNRHDLAVSVHLLGGSTAIQALVFTLHAAALLAMMLGWHTRAATAASWLLTLSLHLRNPFLVYGADVLLRLLMLWGILLPLGARWSLDAATAPVAARERTHCFGIAAIGVQLQVAAVMFIAGAAKMATPFWLRGEGLATALDHEFHTRPLGFWVQRQGWLVRPLNHLVMGIEGAGAILVFAPRWPLRVLVVLAMWAMLAGIASTMEVGFFAHATAVALLVFVPSQAWDRIARAVSRSERLSRWRMRALGLTARWFPSARVDVVESGSRLPRLPHLLAELFAAWLIAYTAIWNVGFWYDRDYEPPAGFAELGSALFLWQQWGMFTSIETTGWFVVPGNLEDGRSIDLMANRGRLPTLEQAMEQPPDYRRPQHIAERLPNIHWQAHFATMVLAPDQPGPFRYYSRYLCREWNRRHSGGQALRTLQIIYMTRPTQPHPAAHAETEYERRVLWTHDCFG